ncbi:hypothetical protein SELMODRAFT_430174 [Selaginella moellendorffii]|uniref:Uncharacterized protein n=1 Tax=Selaginella moellendorffii TaxID=88036 RepID=D8T8K8_SELML|nr:hypothetical protein SELMODRAFT_430174 [Selaginella moellendorffii]
MAQARRTDPGTRSLNSRRTIIFLCLPGRKSGPRKVEECTAVKVMDGFSRHVLKDVVEMPVLAYAESITACKVASGAELKVSMTSSISPFAAKPSQDIPAGNSSKQSSCLIAIFWTFASIRAVHDTFCGMDKEGLGPVNATAAGDHGQPQLRHSASQGQQLVHVHVCRDHGIPR